MDFVVQLFLEDEDSKDGSKTSTKAYQVQKTGTLQATSKVQAQRKKTVGSQVSFYKQTFNFYTNQCFQRPSLGYQVGF